MRQTTGIRKSPSEKIVKDIKRAKRKHYSSEEKVRIVLNGLRGEDSIVTAFTRNGSAPEQVSVADVDKLHAKIGQLVVERDF